MARIFANRSVTTGHQEFLDETEVERKVSDHDDDNNRVRRSIELGRIDIDDEDLV